MASAINARLQSTFLPSENSKLFFRASYGSPEVDLRGLRKKVNWTPQCAKLRGNVVFAAVAGAPSSSVASDVEIPKGSFWSVHKFGGTCVGTPERIINVAKIISSDNSRMKLVTVSAMAKVTDMLYSLLENAANRENIYEETLLAIYEKHKNAATELMGEGSDLDSFLVQLEEDIQNLKAVLKAIFITGNATEAPSDFVVGHGELWSAQILAATVRKISGKPTKWLDARQVLIVTPSGPKQVDPDYISSENKLDEWYQRNLAGKEEVSTIIATGFIASTAEGVPTTLKRDGSDFSAAIFGSLVRAGRVTIWTDVDGVYSADPRKVSDAVVLESLSYREAWEMSYFGANVLHPRTTIPVMKYDIPVVIRNAFNLQSPGTTIGPLAESDSDSDMPTHARLVKGFATIDNVALISVEGTGMAGVPGTASAIFEAVKNVGANVIMISQASSEHSVCFAVPETDAELVESALNDRFKVAIEAGRLSKVAVISGCTVLAAVGQKMASKPGVASSLFGALADSAINIRAIAQGCSEYNVTIVVGQTDSERALRAVHKKFLFGGAAGSVELGVGLIGPGLIGGTLLDQLRDQESILRKEFNVDLKVLGILGSRKMLLNSEGINLSSWAELMQSDQSEPADVARFTRHLSSSSSHSVVVDCTASADVAQNYLDWLKSGCHVITPNKKANSGPLRTYLALRSYQRKSKSHYFYEGTVGAGLPLIGTLQSLIESGDRVLTIEGIFSGTLSYIFNSFSGPVKFSQVVNEAKASGYTEPDPRDDLSGMDVARKVVILARECGLRLEIEDIPLESLVPKSLQGVESVEEFMAELPRFDSEMEARQAEAQAEGEVLRYVGVVDVAKKEGSVQLRRYPASHAFAQLAGSDNIISFTTARYKTNPLIIRGPGAGAEVTAGGVFSDILRLAAYLGAPS